MFRNLNIGLRLGLLVAGGSSLLVAAVIALSIIITLDHLQADARRTLRAQNQRAAEMLDTQVQAIITATRQLALSASAQDRAETFLGGAAPTILDNSSESLVRYVNLALFGGPALRFDRRSSQIVAHTQNIEAGTWFLRAAEETSLVWHLSDAPALDEAEADGEAILGLAAPILDDSGQAVGILWTETPHSALQAAIAQSAMQPGFTMPAFRLLTDDGMIYGSQGLVSATDSAHELMMLLSSPQTQAVLRASRGPGEVSAPFDNPFQPEDAVFLIASALPKTGWQLLSAFSASVLPQLSGANFVPILLLALLGTAALLAAIYRYVLKNIREPLQTLGRAAQEIGAGDLRYAIDYQERSGEIGQLARSLEDMKQNLTHTYEQLSRWNQSLEQRIARKSSEADQAQREIQRRLAQLGAVYEQSALVAGAEALPASLKAFSDRTREMLQATYCGIWLLTGEQDRLQLITDSAMNGSLLHATISLDRGMVGKVVSEGKTISVDDYQRLPDKLTIGHEEDIRRAICVPMWAGRKAFGAVLAGRPIHAPVFSDEDERLLTLLVNIVAAAIRIAQLTAQVDQPKRRPE